MILREESTKTTHSLGFDKFNEREREIIESKFIPGKMKNDSLTKTNFPPFKRVEFTIPLSLFDKILGHPRPLIQRNSKTPRHLLSRCIKHRLLLSSLH